jgi:hypothetical protein
MPFGRIRPAGQIVEEYLRLAREDEDTGRYLARSARHRHAIYFLVQSMEKYVRAKAFLFVDPTDRNVRDMYHNHSLDDALDLLIEVVAGDSYVKQQINQQIQDFLIEELRFEWIHNNLRYPFYLERVAAFQVLDVASKDSDFMIQRLDWLKRFLNDLDQLS